MIKKTALLIHYPINLSHIKNTLLICILAINFSLISQNDTIQSAVKTYQSQKYNFDISYPYDWKVIQIDKHELLLSKPNIKKGVVATTFDIQVNNDSPSLKSYIKKYQASLYDSKTFINVKLSSKKKILFKGNKSYELHYTALVQQLPIEWKSIIFKYKNHVFKLTTTSQMNELLLMKATTDSIYNSFHFQL